MLRLRAIRASGDQGVAIVVAISVMVIALALSLTVVTLAVRQTQDSGTVRQRAVAVNAAEAAVDATFTTFQAAGPTLPCGPTAFPALTANVPVDAPVATIKVDYFKVDGTPITDCAVVQANLTRKPMRALVTATATTSGAGTEQASTRAMQAYVTLLPKMSQGFDKAIFSNGTLTVNNNHEVFGDGADNADVYSNADVVCPNGSNQTYHGSIYAQGKITFVGQCSVAGDVWAKGAVSLQHNQTTVGGGVTSSTSSVSVASLDKVAGTITAYTAVPTGCGSKCISGLLQGPPPAQPFPQMPMSKIDAWSVAAPDGPGYQRVADVGCTNTISGLQSAAGLGGAGKVVYTPCAVNINGQDLKLKNDLVIYATGGFAAANQVNVTSADGLPHKLYMIVPYGITCGSGSAPFGNITADNKFAVADNIDLMMYTPCNIDIDNHNDHFGQVFAGGTVNIDNHFDMHFQPLPMFGVDAASLPVMSYKVDIQYKREVRP
jgi:Tfp pilus assembly protein PilX